MLLQRPTTGVCHALLRFPTHSGPTCNVEVSHTQWPLLHHVVQAVHKGGHTDMSHPQSTEHDTQPIAYLISKQAIPYRTRGGTCCPGGSTPKIRSLADLNLKSHITWRNPTVSTSPTLLKPQHRSSLRSPHISTDGRLTLSIFNTSQTRQYKDGKTCTTLMTAWLSITSQVWTQTPKVWGLGNNINACRSICELEREST
jgi:hypothetical protein